MHQQDWAEVLEEMARRFDVVIRGYDRAQVDELLDRLGKEVSSLQADRNALATRAERLTEHLATMTAETEALKASARAAGESNPESMGTRISRMLKLAEEEAVDIRFSALEEQTRARAEFESSRQQCAGMQTEAQRVVSQAQDDARRVQDEAQDRAASLVAAAQRNVDEMIVRAHESVEQVEAQGESRMAKIVDDVELSLKSRKAEAARIEQERDQASRHEADLRIEQARAEAESMIASAEQRVAELETQRVDVDTWLGHLRQALAAVPAAPHTDWTTQPRGSEAPPVIPAEDPDRESDGAGPDGTVLAREDILEYRHMRRSLR